MSKLHQLRLSSPTHDRSNSVNPRLTAIIPTRSSSYSSKYEKKKLFLAQQKERNSTPIKSLNKKNATILGQTQPTRTDEDELNRKTHLPETHDNRVSQTQRSPRSQAQSTQRSPPKSPVPYHVVRMSHSIDDEIRRTKEDILNSDEEGKFGEAEEPIRIITSQEIETQFLETSKANQMTSDEERKILRKKIKSEKYSDVEVQEALLRYSSEFSPPHKEYMKTKSPSFKLKEGQSYVEQQVIKTMVTEIFPRKRLRLTPLLNRENYLLEENEDKNLFREDERKIVTIRRQEYAKREKGMIRDIEIIELQRRRLEAALIIQRWFRKRRFALLPRRSTIPMKDEIGTEKPKEGLSSDSGSTLFDPEESESSASSQSSKKPRRKRGDRVYKSDPDLSSSFIDPSDLSSQEEELRSNLKDKSALERLNRLEARKQESLARKQKDEAKRKEEEFRRKQIEEAKRRVEAHKKELEEKARQKQAQLEAGRAMMEAERRRKAEEARRLADKLMGDADMQEMERRRRAAEDLAEKEADERAIQELTQSQKAEAVKAAADEEERRRLAEYAIAKNNAPQEEEEIRFVEEELMIMPENIEGANTGTDEVEEIHVVKGHRVEEHIKRAEHDDYFDRISFIGANEIEEPIQDGVEKGLKRAGDSRSAEKERLAQEAELFQKQRAQEEEELEAKLAAEKEAWRKRKVYDEVRILNEDEEIEENEDKKRKENEINAENQRLVEIGRARREEDEKQRLLNEQLMELQNKKKRFDDARAANEGEEETEDNRTKKAADLLEKERLNEARELRSKEIGDELEKKKLQRYQNIRRSAETQEELTLEEKEEKAKKTNKLEEEKQRLATAAKDHQDFLASQIEEENLKKKLEQLKDATISKESQEPVSEADASDIRKRKFANETEKIRLADEAESCNLAQKAKEEEEELLRKQRRKEAERLKALKQIEEDLKKKGAAYESERVKEEETASLDEESLAGRRKRDRNLDELSKLATEREEQSLIKNLEDERLAQELENLRRQKEKEEQELRRAREIQEALLKKENAFQASREVRAGEEPVIEESNRNSQRDRQKAEDEKVRLAQKAKELKDAKEAEEERLTREAEESKRKKDRKLEEARLSLEALRQKEKNYGESRALREKEEFELYEAEEAKNKKRKNDLENDRLTEAVQELLEKTRLAEEELAIQNELQKLLEKQKKLGDNYESLRSSTQYEQGVLEHEEAKGLQKARRDVDEKERLAIEINTILTEKERTEKEKLLKELEEKERLFKIAEDQRRARELEDALRKKDKEEAARLARLTEENSRQKENWLRDSRIVKEEEEAGGDEEAKRKLIHKKGEEEKLRISEVARQAEEERVQREAEENRRNLVAEEKARRLREIEEELKRKQANFHQARGDKEYEVDAESEGVSRTKNKEIDNERLRLGEIASQAEEERIKKEIEENRKRKEEAEKARLLREAEETLRSKKNHYEKSRRATAEEETGDSEAITRSKLKFNSEKLKIAEAVKEAEDALKSQAEDELRRQAEEEAARLTREINEARRKKQKAFDKLISEKEAEEPIGKKSEDIRNSGSEKGRITDHVQQQEEARLAKLAEEERIHKEHQDYLNRKRKEEEALRASELENQALLKKSENYQASRQKNQYEEANEEEILMKNKKRDEDSFKERSLISETAGLYLNDKRKVYELSRATCETEESTLPQCSEDLTKSRSLIQEEHLRIAELAKTACDERAAKELERLARIKEEDKLRRKNQVYNESRELVEREIPYIREDHREKIANERAQVANLAADIRLSQEKEAEYLRRLQEKQEEEMRRAKEQEAALLKRQKEFEGSRSLTEMDEPFLLRDFQSPQTRIRHSEEQSRLAGVIDEIFKRNRREEELSRAAAEAEELLRKKLANYEKSRIGEELEGSLQAEDEGQKFSRKKNRVLNEKRRIAKLQKEIDQSKLDKEAEELRKSKEKDLENLRALLDAEEMRKKKEQELEAIRAAKELEEELRRKRKYYEEKRLRKEADEASALEEAERARRKRDKSVIEKSQIAKILKEAEELRLSIHAEEESVTAEELRKKQRENEAARISDEVQLLLKENEEEEEQRIAARRKFLEQKLKEFENQRLSQEDEMIDEKVYEAEEIKNRALAEKIRISSDVNEAENLQLLQKREEDRNAQEAERRRKEKEKLVQKQLAYESTRNQLEGEEEPELTRKVAGGSHNLSQKQEADRLAQEAFNSIEQANAKSNELAILQRQRHYDGGRFNTEAEEPLSAEITLPQKKPEKFRLAEEVDRYRKSEAKYLDAQRKGAISRLRNLENKAATKIQRAFRKHQEELKAKKNQFDHKFLMEDFSHFCEKELGENKSHQHCLATEVITLFMCYKMQQAKSASGSPIRLN